MTDRECRKFSWKPDALAAAAIFALALAARLLFLFASSDRHWPYSVFYEGDAPTWVRWAQALARGEAFEFDLPLRTPGAAYLLYWLGAADVESFLAIKALWCVMSAAACAVVYLGCREVFSRRVSLIAAIGCAFSFGLHVAATSLNNETPYMLVLFASAWLTLRLTRRPSLWLAAALAALHGAGMLLRAEHALVLVMMAAYAMWTLPGETRLRHRITIAAVIVLGAIVICLPWSVRGITAIHRFNTQHEPLPAYDRAQPPWTDEARAYLDSLPAFARDGNFQFISHLARVEGRNEVNRDDVERFFAQRFGYVPQSLSRFVLVSMKGPLDFALANHPDADGGFSRAALGGEDVELAFANPHHLKLINHGYAAGWDSIRSDVRGWISLVANKLRRFGDGVALGLAGRNLPLGVEGVRRPVDLLTPAPGNVVAFGWRILVWTLVLGGVAIACARRVGGLWLLIIAYKLIVTILFYGYARQAVSILPAFLVFSGLMIDWLATHSFDRLRISGRGRWTIAAIVIAALLAIEVFAAMRPVAVEARGPVRAAPEWGEGAFESFRRIEIIDAVR